MISILGRWFLGFLQDAGGIFLFLIKAFLYSFVPPFRIRLIIKHIEFIGVKSVLIVSLTALFSGMVTAYQVYHALAKFEGQSVLGGVVALILTRELGPVLTAIMVVARAGSAITAEIATMKITEQIDALKVMAINPIQYIITPRLWAVIVALPILTIIANFVGIAGGYIVAIFILGMDPGIIIAKTRDMLEFFDIIAGILKSVCFGILIIGICTYKGFTTTGGAEGVGKSTTQAVVISSVAILIADYILTTFLFVE